MKKALKPCTLIAALIFCFTLSPSIWAEPGTRTTKHLDHSWRKNHILPLPAQQKNNQPETSNDIFTSSYMSYDDGTWYTPGTNPRVYQPNIDVQNYIIDATFNKGADPYPDNANLSAVVTISALAKSSIVTEIVVDLYDNITIDSISFNGEEITDPDNYTRTDNKIWISLSASKSVAPGDPFDIVVDYNRVYGGTYQGLGFKTHGDSENPAFYTISQPYFSPGWRPCIDVTYDKATADIYITCPDWMVTASNGLLQPGYPIDNGNGTKTAYWKESYPMYTSALSVAMTDYTTWTDTYVSPLDNSKTMPLYYCAFPEDSSKAMQDFAISKDAMEFYATIYGEYPFINEKYGVAETPNTRGCLEHQTMTSLTISVTKKAVNWDVIVHELSHQWWGDSVTCSTWNHVWLHEGFATYSEILFNEHYTGEPAGQFMSVEYDDGLYDGDLAETVYCEDEHLDNPFAPTGSIYEKGSWVLHMLRRMMGDTAFFTAIQSFHQEYLHSTMETSDFKESLEDEFGSSLTDFFDQWLYTPYRPIYSVIYENASRDGGYLVDIQLMQTQPHSIKDFNGNILRDYYIMPVDFTVHYTDSTTELFTVINNQRNQHFQLLTTKQPDYTVFDEGKNLLKVAQEQTTDNDGVFIDGDNSTVFGDNTCTAGATENCDDNCPYKPNGKDLGTCMTVADMPMGTGITCTDNSTCEPGEVCDMGQTDINSNGIGDVCECYANINNDNYVGFADLIALKIEFNKPCTPENPCLADIDNNGNVGFSDLIIMKKQYGWNNCVPIP